MSVGFVANICVLVAGTTTKQEIRVPPFPVLWQRLCFLYQLYAYILYFSAFLRLIVLHND